VRHRFFRPARQSGLVASLLAVMLGAAFDAGEANADALDAILARGKLLVGTKSDYPPFGYRNEAGAVVGFEPDLAQEVAQKLGVALELMPVATATRLPLLIDGKIDLIIATMNDTPERRKQVAIIQPSYYASGVNVFAAKSAHLRLWQQLRGKPVCMIEGSFYIREIKERYGPEVTTFKSTSEMYTALRQAACAAAVYDDTALIAQLQRSEWRQFEMPLRSIMVEPWGMAVRLGESRLESIISDLVREWHRSGRIEALERKWKIPPSAFAEEMHHKLAEN
jgi:polar amino acid transport system substrate-binding protein